MKPSLLQTMKAKVIDSFDMGTSMVYNYMDTRRTRMHKRGNTQYIFDVLIVLVMAGAILGTAFSSLNDLKNDGNFTAAEKALLGVVGIAVVYGLVRYFLGKAGTRS